MRAFVCIMSLLAFVVGQTPVALVHAQSGTDSTPPTIVHTPLDAPMELDEPFLVRATVSDDVGVSHVRLFFRAEGADAYRSVEMAREKGDTYGGTIPAHRRADRAIEYFIQAEDDAGNIALRGGAFEPLRIADPSAVEPGDAASRLAMQTPVAEKPWYKKWWVWTIAGAVVIAAAAGGGGGGGGGDEPEPSGTATITAPIP